MKLVIPNLARLQGIESFLKRVEGAGAGDLEIEIPYRYFNVHPMVVAATAAAGIATLARGDKVTINSPTECSGVAYLTRMGLFSVLNLESPMTINEHEHAGRFVPLRVVTNGAELSRFIQDLAPLLHQSPEDAAAISYAVAELVRNTLEHAGPGAKAVVAAQMFHATGVIGLGVADCGIGVRKSLSGAHYVTDDLDAIQLALEPGITGTTQRIGGTESNAGAGLFFCKGMAYTSRNYFVIASGKAMFKLLCVPRAKSVDAIYVDANSDRATRRDDIPPWQGTLVGLDFAGEGQSATFPAFLRFMSDAYDVGTREARRAKYKRAAVFT